MRPARLLLVALLAACASKPGPSVKAPGNLPVKTESELAAEEAARQACLDACPESEEREPCEDACMSEHPITQVEVIPDGLPR